MLEPAITKSTVQILKFIKKHQNCSFSVLQQSFNELDYMELVNLALTGYLLCQRPNQLPTDFRDGNFTVPDDAVFWASPKTEQLIEERRRGWLQWVIPTCISGLALIISTLAFIMSLLPQVTQVQILP